jgi:ribosome-associated toxin RatA of RatAB toxin-antitoxin module
MGRLGGDLVMPTIEISEQVAATPQEFFDATLAVNQIPGYVEWHPAFVGTGLRILRLTEGAGTTFEFALQGTGATGHAEVVEYAPERFVARMSGGLFSESTTTWTAAPRGASCTITHEFSYRLRFAPISYLVDVFMVRPRLRRLAEEQVAACKQRAEEYASRVGAATSPVVADGEPAG